jgi:hypothetical protein
MRRTGQAKPTSNAPRDMPVTSRPTAERSRRAVAVDPPDINGTAFRPWFRVRTRLDALHAAGAIDDAEYAGACAFRADWHRVAGGVTSSLALDGIGAGVAASDSAHAHAIAGVAAAGRLRLIRARLGAEGFRLLELSFADDTSWAAIGRAFDCTRETARDRTVKAIRRLVPRRPPGIPPVVTPSRYTTINIYIYIA